MLKSCGGINIWWDEDHGEMEEFQKRRGAKSLGNMEKNQQDIIIADSEIESHRCVISKRIVLK